MEHISRERAYEILTKYMVGKNYLEHSLAVEAIMKKLAERLAPNEVEFWGVCGLLHDLDEEHCDWKNHPEGHGPKSIEILKSEGDCADLSRQKSGKCKAKVSYKEI